MTSSLRRRFCIVVSSALLSLLIGVTEHRASAQEKSQPPSGPQRKRVGILIYPDVEPLDFCGPFEVFSVAFAEGGEQNHEKARLFDVVLVAETKDPVRARGGLRVLPDHTLTDCPRLDIVVVPGTDKVQRLQAPALVKWMRDQADKAELVTSVCTGAFLLAQAGLLDGKQATSHAAAIGPMRTLFPKVKVVQGQRYVRDGKVITSAGVSAGIDMSLHVVAGLYGEKVSKAAAKLMEYESAGGAVGKD